MVVPNNDIKYHTNKCRAKLFADLTHQRINYSQAHDKPTAVALRESPRIASRKLDWLQKYDRETANLFGMLPLAQGMRLRLRLTDHFD